MPAFTFRLERLDGTGMLDGPDLRARADVVAVPTPSFVM
jgi:hypothetical protein